MTTTTETRPAPASVIPCVPALDADRRAWVGAWCAGASALGPILARPVHHAGVVVLTAPDGTVVGVVDTVAPATVAEVGVLLAYVHAGACAAAEAADDAALGLLAAAAGHAGHHAV